MSAVLQFLGQFWWLIFVFGGSIAGALKAIAAANERRLDRRQERFRIKQETKVAIAQAKAQDTADETTQRRQIGRTLADHERTDAEWFAYEMDPVTILDHPMMTDMREPLTVDFHTARRRADLLRPSDEQAVDAMIGDREAQAEYRDAVHAYATAFDVAEAESRRRRRGGYSPDEQEHLARAQNMLRLAMDDGATPQERQNAYRRAQKELEGLVDLPSGTRTEIERRVAGQLEA